jgi:hypothetical protein
MPVRNDKYSVFSRFGGFKSVLRCRNAMQRNLRVRDTFISHAVRESCMHLPAVMPGDHPVARYLPVLLLLAALPLCASAAPLQVVQGEEMVLRGTAPGMDVLYLFLTGPNLPVEGISLEGGTPVVTGNPASFTQAEVNTDGTWTYTWRTGEIGRILSPGTYTLYTVQEPLSRPDLGDTVYALQPVVFGASAGVVIETTPATTGSLLVDSSPGMSFVVLDNRTAGITPLQVSGIPPGPHSIVISRNGYADYRADVTITTGERTEVSAVLLPLAITPAPAGTPTTGTTAPVGSALPVLVPLGAAALVLLGYHRRSRRGGRRLQRQGE